MDFISTAFDPASADFLAEIGVDAFKIASADLRNWPLLEYVAKLKKPIIMSCGGGVLEDIKASVEKVLKWNRNLALLDCVMTYPSAAEDMNLRVIETFRKEFPDLVIGLSDHFNGISMASVAYVLGARVFEKHFTINRAWKGTDQVFSLEPIGMHKMIRDLYRVEQALGDGIKKVLPQEKEAVLKMGKSIVALRSLKKGHKITKKDITFKSPGNGLTPNRLEEIVGLTLNLSVEKDHLFSMSDFQS